MEESTNKIEIDTNKPEIKEINEINEEDIKDLEKDVQNYMKFKVVRNQKTSLKDPLDILIKEPTLIPIQKILEQYESNPNINQEIKQKKYNSGLALNNYLGENDEMVSSSIDKDSINEELLKKLESSLDSDLDLYIKKLYCKFNYSPIIKKIFGKKINFAQLEKLATLWHFYVEIKIKNDEKMMKEFKEKVLKALTDNIKLLIRHIFSIMRIREAIYSINYIFQVHYFYIIKEAEKKRKEKAMDMRTVNIDPMKEISGNGVCFILIKELKRAINMLLYSSKYLFYSFESLFNNDFKLLYMTLRKIYYDFFLKNCFFSTLLFNIKSIFIRSNMKEVCDEIDELTLPFEYDFDVKFIKDEYANIKFDNSEETLFDFKNCFDQLGYSVDKNDEKGEEVATEEEKKINEMKDIDELVKYIEGDSSKKKKKKRKKKKENPINILDQFIMENKNLDDETLSQSSLSVTSYDSVVSEFKRDLKEESFDNNIKKIRPNFSQDFQAKFI